MQDSTNTRSRARTSPVGALSLAASLTVGALAAAPAAAQIKATLAPIRNVVTGAFQGGTRFDYCPGSYCPPARDCRDPPVGQGPLPIPLEWEVIIENDDPTQSVTLSYFDNVSDGQNGLELSLLCPPTFLPGPATASCNAFSGDLQVDNIVIGPCERVSIRYETLVNGGGPGPDICNGGTVSPGGLRTIPPQAVPRPVPQSPSDPDDTCFFINSMCNLDQGKNLRLFQSMTDLNGPPLLPGDLVHVRAWFDLRFVDILPMNEFRFRWMYPSASGPDTPAPLPPNIDFVRFVDMPLAPTYIPASDYVYNPRPTHNITIGENSPNVDIPAGLTVLDIVTWEGRIQCDSPSGEEHCFSGILRHQFGFAETDDPVTLDDVSDDTCVTTALPDFGNSTKSVRDQDGSGDAQPGETLTFDVTVENGTSCPAHLMNCECAGTDVLVTDTILDTTVLDFNTVALVPQPGVSMTTMAPDQVLITIDDVGPVGAPDNPEVVSFTVQVRSDATDTDQVCNEAEITSAERLSVLDGGLLENCPSFPPAMVTLQPCMNVVVPPTCLAISKTITTPAPYEIGDTVTYDVTVSNCGTTTLNSVDVWDCLDPIWNPATVVVTGPGAVNQAPAPVPACPSGNWVRWNTIPSLAQAASETYTVSALIAECLADGFSIDNIAYATAPAIGSTMQSSAPFDVCAPELLVTKTETSTPAMPPAYLNGETVTWTLSVENVGSCDANNLVLTDNFPTELTISNAPAGCSGASTSNLSCTLGSLVAGAGPTDFVIDTTFNVIGPETVCNVGSGVSDECPSQPINTDPPVCVMLDTGDICPPTLPRIRDLLAVKSPPVSGADVLMTWGIEAMATDGYEVHSVLAKTDIPTVPLAPAAPVCLAIPTGTPTCTDPGAVTGPDPQIFYQVLSQCGATVSPV